MASVAGRVERRRRRWSWPREQCSPYGRGAIGVRAHPGDSLSQDTPACSLWGRALRLPDSLCSANLPPRPVGASLWESWVVSGRGLKPGVRPKVALAHGYPCGNHGHPRASREWCGWPPPAPFLRCRSQAGPVGPLGQRGGHGVLSPHSTSWKDSGGGSPRSLTHPWSSASRL